MVAQQQFQERLDIATQECGPSRLVAAAAAITACVIGGWWLAHADFRSPAQEPVSEPTRVLAPDPQAPFVASAFVAAYAAFDRPGVLSRVDHKAGAWDVGMGADWRKLNRFLDVTKGNVIPHPCMSTGTTVVGTTMHCPFAYHDLGSEQIGRDSYEGSFFDVTILGGQVVAASMSLDYTDHRFSAQTWAPFAAWVTRTHPKDAAVMYDDWPSQSSQAMTPEALRLWARNTQAYVDRVLANRARR